ncbi:MAG: ammonia-forming cytochrome c nitrite reductase subunit c552 [Bacillota bacterium]|nr:ammonia-forming cytochrome c nitrite reductase subunit c552 [Bacillota bacterium]
MRGAKLLVVAVVVALCLAGFAALVSSAENAPAKIPSLNDQAKNSPLGSRHWNIFRNVYNNPEDPEQTRCLSCHSAVVIVDDPKAQLPDFLRKGQKYCYEELENPAPGQSPFLYKEVTEDGKYADNELEGITCRVCHVMDKNGLTLRRPDNTCTLCHGRVFNWKTGSGHHVTQDFIEGHGETYWSPSVHYTLGMRCESCHTMNAIKHDYEPAKPEDIVRDGKCMGCHRSADELEKMIETTKKTVSAALESIDARVKAAQDLVAAKKVKDAKAAETLIAKAKARYAFIEGDLSHGVHNPQFAGQLINEAFAALDEFDKLVGKATKTAPVNLGNLMVYSQAQSSELGNRHWDMLERTIFNPEDPDQDRCIVCHSAVAIVDDPKAKVADFLQKGQKYCVQELTNVPPGQSPFVYATAEQDGKYVKNRLEGITCRVCHTFDTANGTIGLRRNKEQTCGLCHGRAFNWNTGSGHHVELAFFKGQGSKEKGVPDMPSLKVSMGFACQDCHFMDNTKHDYAPATPEQIAAHPKCKSCHTAKEVGERIESIQKEVKAALAKLEPRLAKAKAYVDKNPQNAEAKELYIQAQAGVNFVEDDFSYGVHNPAFARALLERSDKLLNQFEAKFK